MSNINIKHVFVDNGIISETLESINFESEGTVIRTQMQNADLSDEKVLVISAKKNTKIIIDVDSDGNFNVRASKNIHFYY